jgi:hypothetical protein
VKGVAIKVPLGFCYFLAVSIVCYRNGEKSHMDASQQRC